MLSASVSWLQAAELTYTRSVRLPLDAASALLLGDMVQSVVHGGGQASVLRTEASLNVNQKAYKVKLQVGFDLWKERHAAPDATGWRCSAPAARLWASRAAEQLLKYEHQLGPATALQQPWDALGATPTWSAFNSLQSITSRSISMAYIGGGLHIAGRYDRVWRWALICGLGMRGGGMADQEIKTWLDRWVRLWRCGGGICMFVGAGSSSLSSIVSVVLLILSRAGTWLRATWRSVPALCQWRR
jgi:hypothetical protein